MQTKFTSSVNVIRDSSRTLNYIPTPNAASIVNQISNDFKKGIRSFNIIGSFGTGKSSFLWALEQSLLGKKRIFPVNILNGGKTRVINFVGEYESLSEHFAEHFELSARKFKNEDIFLEIFSKYKALGSKNPLLVLVIDEFGKFLEYASENNPEKELYFIQQLAEFVNNPDYNIMLITTVHQNFDAYGIALNKSQKAEWTKVKGRFREIGFNEPVEQLLFLASEGIKKKNIPASTEKEIRQVLSLLKKAKAFNINYQYSTEVASKLFPLDILSAYLLTVCLQRYGQNERSLFSFLESTDKTSLAYFDERKDKFYSIPYVYDYLVFNFYSFLSSRYNPDFSSWSAIKNSLDTVERTFTSGIDDYFKIIKTIGLLNVTATAGSELGQEFLTSYCESVLELRNADRLIEKLKDKKVIVYRNYAKRFVLVEGTDLDITSALLDAGNRVDEINDVTTLLNRYYQLAPVYAKEYYYRTGTPRLFEYKITEDALGEEPRDEIDGFVNLVFSDKLNVNDIKKKSVDNQAIIYAFYSKTKSIKSLLFEIEKTKKVLEDNLNDRIANKELTEIFRHQKLLLNHFIVNNLYSKKSEVVWIYNGEVLKVANKKAFTKLLSEICHKVYPNAPVFKNELVNKHRVSSSIFTARKLYFTALVDRWNQADLGFPADKFPAEKTIYLTLLKNNGIKLYMDEVDYTIKVSKNSSFNPLWKYSVHFLESAKKSKKSLTEFIDPLTKPPFKLKQGLIDFWIASFLFIKRDDFALFNDAGFVPVINDEVLDLMVKRPHEYELKTFDIEGVKLDIFNSYRHFLNQDSKEKVSNDTFIETIKPFLTFYKGLPEYTKNTKRLKAESIAVREAIARAKDPERAFFEEFPHALGYTIADLQTTKSTLKEYIVSFQDAIRELRTAHTDLIGRFEEFIQNEIVGDESPYPLYKRKLQSRFKKIKKHLCLPHQKTFIARLDSPIEERDNWLNSIAQSVLSRPLDSMKDEDELVLFDKVKKIITELDSLMNLVDDEMDELKEDVFGIEFNSFSRGSQKKVIRYPKSKKVEISKVEDLIKTKLSGDETVNIAALSNLLQKMFSNE